MKLEKISNYVLWGVSAVIVLSFLAFFLIGYDNMEGDKNAPQLTGFLLVLQYLLGVVTFVLMAWSVVVSARNSSSADEKKTTGMPGSKVILFTCVLTLVSLAVGFVIGLSAEDFTTSSGVYTPASMVQLVDTFLWAIYILSGASLIAMVASSIGLLKK